MQKLQVNDLVTFGNSTNVTVHAVISYEDCQIPVSNDLSYGNISMCPDFLVAAPDKLALDTAFKLIKHLRELSNEQPISIT